jgi:uncharacterized RDD family membrane protein YckC
MSDVVTGEAVPLGLRLAALPSRALAALIDLLVQLAAVFLLSLLLSGLQFELESALQAALGVVLYVAILVGYPVAAETLWRGRTIGKAALGLRVVRDDGGPIRFRQALVRGLIGGIVEKPGVLLFTVVVGVVSALVSARGKRLGDVLAGTVVLQERVPVRGGPVATMPPTLAGWAATLDLSGLPDDLALASRQFMARADSLEHHAREQLGARLVSAVSAVVRPPPPPGTTGWEYLSAVLAERRRREEERLGRQAPRPASAAPPAAAAATAATPAVPVAPQVEPVPRSAAEAPAKGFAPPG